MGKRNNQRQKRRFFTTSGAVTPSGFCSRKGTVIIMKTDLEQLVRKLVSTNDLNELVDTAALVLGNPVAVYSASYSVLAYAKVYTVEDPLWVGTMKRGYWNYELITELTRTKELAAGADEKSYSIITNLSNLRRRFGKLFMQHEHIGFYLVLESQSPLEDVPDSVYEAVQGVLAKSVSIMQSLTRFKNIPRFERVLVDLIEGNHRNQAQLRARIEDTEFARFRSFRIVAIDMASFTHEHNVPDILENRLKNGIQAIFPESWSLYYQSNPIVLIALRHEDLSLDHAMKELESLLKRHTVSAGVSDLFSDLFCLPTYYRQSLKALEHRALFHDPRAIVFYEDYRICDGTALLMQDKSLFFCCSEKIMRVINYDKKNNTELVYYEGGLSKPYKFIVAAGSFVAECAA